MVASHTDQTGKMTNSPVVNRLEALAIIVRLPAVLAYSGGGLMLAVGLAAREHLIDSAWLNFALLTLAVVLMHGIMAHAVNDWMDWQTGTDRFSPGLLSGGSRVIPLRLLEPGHLVQISILALVITLILTGILVYQLGWPILLTFFVGLWSVTAYSLPPFMLSYRPLAGEWLCAFPALLAVIWGAHWSLTKVISNRLVLTSLIYGFLGQAWLAEHHLADIGADLAAQPAKITTVAWIAQRFGLSTARFVPAAYAALALPLIIYSKNLFQQPQLMHLAWPALGSIFAALWAPPKNPVATTWAELLMMILTIVEAGLLIALS
ncbi:MAG TPA: prenyltransferase [Firmicutes bacterium]|nr:prenyltransferase [Bacillota bacterium]